MGRQVYVKCWILLLLCVEMQIKEMKMRSKSETHEYHKPNLESK